MTPEEIVKAVDDLGYECRLLDGVPYLRDDFYSVDMREAQDNYYIIVEMLETIGLEFDDPYIEHDCITGNIQEIPTDDIRHHDYLNINRRSQKTLPDED